MEIVGSFRPQGSPPGADSRWWGSTVRGALGTALKNLVCSVSHRRCDGCQRRGECPFPRIWQPQRPDERGPLLQQPPWLLRVAWQREQLGVVLRLFGSARAEEARLRIALEAALARGLTPARVAFFPDTPLQTRSVVEWRPPPSALCKPLLVRLISPLRLVYDGKPRAQAPDFRSLVASAARRWKLASLSWGWPLPPARFPESMVQVIRCEVAWKDLSRRSTRQRATLTLGGLVGDVTYEGDWAAALPFLQVASVVGVGKLTTHGFGHVVFGVQHGGGGTGSAESEEA